MIQFNLLPDVKLEYLRAQRQRRFVSLICGIATIVSLLLLGSMLANNLVQKKHLKEISDTVASESKTLQNKPQLNRILTVQNQLTSLPGLHDTKPATDRLFLFLAQVTPIEVDISNLSVNFAKNTVTITGNADSLSSVNQYVDTLKFTKYTAVDASGTKYEAKAAFSDVVMSAFNLTTPTAGSSTKNATYTLAFVYDIPIFDITKQVSLAVPKNKVTTRSEVEKPSALFTAPAPGAKQ